MQTNNDPVPDKTIAIKGWLRPALTPVLANRDYDRFADELKEVEAGPGEEVRGDGALRVWLPNGVVCELGAGADPRVAAGWIRELARC